jgi:hypothetical protein
MPQAAEANVWWAEVEDVRERIERRRARENRVSIGRRVSTGDRASTVPAARRGVREVKTGRRLMLVDTATPPAREPRRRPRQRPAQRIGPRPDRIAAWAVVLGFVLVLAAALSSHG